MQVILLLSQQNQECGVRKCTQFKIAVHSTKLLHSAESCFTAIPLARTDEEESNTTRISIIIWSNNNPEHQYALLLLTQA